MRQRDEMEGSYKVQSGVTFTGGLNYATQGDNTTNSVCVYFIQAMISSGVCGNSFTHSSFFMLFIIMHMYVYLYLSFLPSPVSLLITSFLPSPVVLFSSLFHSGSICRFLRRIIRSFQRSGNE